MVNLKQVIDRPTRITSHSSTLLDVAITNNVEMIMNSDIIPNPIADHEISIVINIHKPKHEPEMRTYRSRKNYSQNVFCSLLLGKVQRLNNICNADDVNSQVSILTEVLNGSLDQCAPVVTTEITRSFAPWLDDNLKKRSIGEKNELQSRPKADRSNQLLDNEFK